jgi:gliding motility-associated-like protein
MFKKSVLLFIFITFFCKKDFASHISGGEIYYDCLGGNNYRITLKIYRNCYDSQQELDNYAYVFVYNAAGNFIDSLALPLPGSRILPSVITNPCFTPPNNVCIEEGIYQGVINLPPTAGGYTITYQRCCRNNSIINMTDPGVVGSTYTTHIPGAAFALCNSSPRFSNFPPIFLCAGYPLSFDYSATDPDGDSLFYEFCNPLIGASQNCAFYGPQGIFSSCSEIGTPPPYWSVPWASGYSASYPISSSPAMTINSATGIVSGTPTSIGQYVFGVCVNEFRNGIFLCKSSRDFLINVINCTGLPYASVSVQTNYCFGYQVDFTQNSLNASTYFWDFGDPSITSDISSLEAPGWNYSDSGTYTVTLIINKGTLCADTNSVTFNIQHLLEPEFTTDPDQCFVNNNFSFTATGDFQGNGTFLWNFGEHSSIPTSNTSNCTNIVFDTSGSFPVTLTIMENGCSETYEKNINVYAEPVAKYGLASPVACDLQPVHFKDSCTADSKLLYEWKFGDGTVSSQSDPFHLYEGIGSYSTSLAITTEHGCKDTFSLPAAIEVFPSPHADFYVSPKEATVFSATISAFDESSDAFLCYINWGDGIVEYNCNSSHVFTKSGTYPIMQVVANSYGCYDTAFAEVIIHPEFTFWIPNAFTPDADNVNDVFKPVLVGVHNYSFLIFDRWGEKVFETTNSEEGWNGFIRGKLSENDVYVYKIIFRDDVKNSTHQYIGNVTLVK